MGRFVLQAVLGRLQLRDVVGDRRDELDLTLLTVCLHGCDDRDLVAGRRPHRELAVPEAVAAHQRHDHLAQLLARLDARELGDVVIGAEAQELACPLVRVHDRARRIGQDHDLVRLLEHLRELPRLLLGASAIGDVAGVRDEAAHGRLTREVGGDGLEEAHRAVLRERAVLDQDVARPIRPPVPTRRTSHPDRRGG